MTPDPHFLFLTPSHRESLAGLTYAFQTGKGFAVLIGEAGTGKTTLLRTMLRSLLKARALIALVLNPALNRDEFLEYALRDFGVGSVPVSKAERLLILQRRLLAVRRQGLIAALVVDEAHKLAPDVLEEIRVLSNFETDDGKLLQVLLAGQSELGDLLNRDDLWQFKQRVAVRLWVQTLRDAEVEQYIRHRWTRAGGSLPAPFHDDAVARIALWSRGVPRVVNVICDNALLLAFVARSPWVALEHVREAARDLDLLRGAPEPAVPRNQPPVVEARAAAVVNLPALRTLESYLPESRTSVLGRWAAKLGVV
jgi:general secretion pathway protein A